VTESRQWSGTRTPVTHLHNDDADRQDAVGCVVTYPDAVTWMPKRDHGLLSHAASLLVCGLLAGIVVAAAAFPGVAMSGLAAKAGADTFDSLPDELDVLPPPQISYVYASDGKTLLAMLYDENRRDIPLSEVSVVMQRAMVAAEDARFYEHHGVDIKGVARAFVANQQANGVSQGASTLTMQYVRQAISYSARTPQQVVDATEQTPARKLREMKYALALEKKLTKEQILERYLNIASYGHGAYGIFAASQVYFGKAPKDLTLAEAALIAGLVKAPSDLDPATEKGRPKALERRDYVLDQMVKLGYVTAGQADEAMHAELKIVGKFTPEGCASVQRPELGASFFCDYLYRWWLEQPAFGADSYERESRLKSGGYTIISSLDVTTQSAARKNVEAAVKTGNPYALLVAGVEPGTGHVLAMATNRNFSNDQTNNGANTNPGKKGQRGNYPNTTVPMISGADDVPGYQAGSTFKMFTMVAALEKGLPLDFTINAISPYPSKYRIQPGPATCPNTPIYCPQNAVPATMNGLRNMWTGFGRSVNTYFVPLEEQAGAQNAVDVAKRLGIQFRAHGNPGDYELANKPGAADGWGAFTLGVSATTPLDLVNAYATLANDGVYCEPMPVVEIRDSNGNKLDAANPRCRKAVEPDVARAAVDAARCPVGDQSAFGKCDGATARDVRPTVNHPVAGKTGTTDGNMTATLVAMTKQIAIAGMLVDPDWPTTDRMTAAFGGNPHGPVNGAVTKTLRDAMAKLPAVNFTPPSKDIAFGKRVPIPDVRCQPIDAAKAKIKAAGLNVDVSDTPVPSDCPVGTVGKTDPEGSTVKGGTVVLYQSKGPGNPAPLPPGGGGDPTPGRCRTAPWLCPPPRG
jgi:membrane peptidoglycan carboxypeptidase